MGTLTDFGDVIAELATGTYTVTRWTSVDYEQGVVKLGETEEISLLAIVQQGTARARDLLPENMRSRELREVCTATELRTASGGQPADEIEIDGVAWQVQSVEDWRTLAGYFWAVVVRKDH